MMTLGEKLRSARQEAGLSQRQLCGEYMTRNMLSQIENGSARPSMDTLKYLAERLGKSISYFLEEQAVTSPNQALMASARKAYAAGDPAQCRKELENYREPDEVFDQERWLLESLACMALAEQMIAQGRMPYAAQLLTQASQAGERTSYDTPGMERERLLLLGKTGQVPLVQIDNALANEDEALMFRAEAAVLRKDMDRCAALLAAVEVRETPRWQLLQGECLFAQGDYAGAAACYEQVEAAYPEQVIPRLEICFRELGDFKRAYEYACRGR